MSEISDAIIVVVSEETGTISVAENGELKRGFTRDSLKKYLRSARIPERGAKTPEKKSIFKGKGGNKA
jgi:diadenylate cyclase